MPVTRHDTEGGFTVAELAVTMGLTMLVMASILGVLVSQTNAEKRVSSFADNQEVLRQAMVQMQRDIRSSEPLKKLTNVSDYAIRVDLNVYDTIDSPAPTPIRWRVDTTTDELLREIVDPNDDDVVLAVSHRVGGIVNEPANPLFTYYAPNAANPYVVSGDLAANPADIAQCTIRVHINLVGAPNRGPQPATLASDAQLRNRLPGGLGCNDTTGVIL